MNIEQEIRAQIEKNKGLKLGVGEINNHLSILEGLLRNERDDAQKQVADAYQRGLEDGRNETWEAAKRISVIELNGGLTGKELIKIYGTMDIHKIYDDNTASEAIEKLKKYEKKQKAEDEIKVGDEVRHDRGWTAVVTSIDDDGLSVMDYNGTVASYSDISKFTKTSRHFDIEKILEEMKE